MLAALHKMWPTSGFAHYAPSCGCMLAICCRPRHFASQVIFIGKLVQSTCMQHRHKHRLLHRPTDDQIVSMCSIYWQVRSRHPVQTGHKLVGTYKTHFTLHPCKGIPVWMPQAGTRQTLRAQQSYNVVLGKSALGLPYGLHLRRCKQRPAVQKPCQHPHCRWSGHIVSERSRP